MGTQDRVIEIEAEVMVLGAMYALSLVGLIFWLA